VVDRNAIYVRRSSKILKCGSSKVGGNSWEVAGVNEGSSKVLKCGKSIGKCGRQWRVLKL